jgi:hypothetical protein
MGLNTLDDPAVRSKVLSEPHPAVVSKSKLLALNDLNVLSHYPMRRITGKVFDIVDLIPSWPKEFCPEKTLGLAPITEP